MCFWVVYYDKPSHKKHTSSGQSSQLPAEREARPPSPFRPAQVNLVTCTKWWCKLSDLSRLIALHGLLIFLGLKPAPKVTVSSRPTLQGNPSARSEASTVHLWPQTHGWRWSPLFWPGVFRTLFRAAGSFGYGFLDEFGPFISKLLATQKHSEKAYRFFIKNVAVTVSWHLQAISKSSNLGVSNLQKFTQSISTTNLQILEFRGSPATSYGLLLAGWSFQPPSKSVGMRAFGQLTEGLELTIS